MKTLDRYIIRSFVSTALMFLVAMLLLRVVADLFVNVDEFLEEEQAIGDRVRVILSYYGYQSFAYFIELGGVIIVSSAVFTVARMNHTNELTAMLASGVSMHRVVLPIVLCAMLMGAIVVADQELVIPAVADKLVRKRDEVSTARQFPVRLPSDTQRTIWYANAYRTGEQLMIKPVAIPRNEKYAALARVTGAEGRPYKFEGQSGWLISGAVIASTSYAGPIWANSPDYQRVFAKVSPLEILRDAQRAFRQQNGREVDLRQIRGAADVKLQDAAYGMTIRAERFDADWAAGAAEDRCGGRLERPVFVYTAANGQVMGEFIGTSAQWKVDNTLGGYWELADGAFFCPSDMTPEDLVLWESGRQLNYMSTADLSRAIELGRVQDRRTAELAKYLRFTVPINNLVMLLLGLPFILSRERNIKASAAFCLLTVGAFFAFQHISRQLDMNALVAAWLPVFIFGPASILMLDSVKT